MFPIRSGIGSSDAPKTDTVFIQSLICSALNEIAKQAIIDTSILTFHQMEVEVYFQNEKGIQIPTDAEGNLMPYSPEEEKKVRDNLRDIVWRYHIINPNGLTFRLTPIINYLQAGETIPEDIVAADPFLQRVLANHSNYTQSVYSGNMSAILDSIVNFSDVVEGMSDEQYDEMIRESRNDGDDYVSVAVYDDNSVQCGCDYCERFFETLEMQVRPDDLNFIQRIMLQNF